MKALLLSLMCTFILGGCSTYKQDKNEIRKKAAESQVSDSQSLGGTIQELIQNSTTLNESQKSQLESILAINKQIAEELSQESFRYRSVLIQELLSGSASAKKIKIIKKDIIRIEDARLKNTFDTVEKISQIVSKDPESKKYAERIIMMEPRGKK